MAPGWEDVQIFAVGHSTRSIEEMIDLLWSHGVATLADIRTVPRSRTNPQFNLDVFPAALASAGIRHVHLAALGGLRHARPDSPNTGWRNASFRGYADYMQTAGFEAGLEELRRIAREGPAAIMCAEALRWRCHRSLVADALFARGVVVEHIVSPNRTEPHGPTAFARFRGTRVTYPPERGTIEGR
ncbi:MAG: DUF488 domain-containing protein [Myxococcaceae bacterium]